MLKSSWGGHASSPAFTTDEDIVSILGMDMVKVDSQNGNIIWKHEFDIATTNRLEATPAVDDKDNVYVGTKNNENSVMYAFHADGSGEMWKTHIGSDLYSSPVLGNDRVLYVGSEALGEGGDVSLYALDMNTGEIQWSSYSGSVNWSSPLISQAGVYIGGTGGPPGTDPSKGAVYLIKVKATGYLPGAGSPRFHGSSESTGRRL